MVREIRFTAKGNPQSKANSRRAVILKGRGNGRLAFIKSKTALEYVEAFKIQCPNLNGTEAGLMDGELGLSVSIWYQSNRSDLDESIIMDAMQGMVYENDRQVKLKVIEHMGVDKENPRADIVVWQLGERGNAKKEKNKKPTR